MIALPRKGVEAFAHRLEGTWARERTGLCKRRDALALGAALCGLRAEEVLQLNWGDVFSERGVIHVRTVKKGVHRVIDVGVSWCSGLYDVHQAFLDRYEGCFEHGRGICFVTRRGRRLSYEALLRRCKAFTKSHFGDAYSIHCLRHAAACRCYAATGDVRAVQRMLGHKSLEHTAVYLRSFEEVDSVGLCSPWEEGRTFRVVTSDGDTFIPRRA